MAQRCLGFSLAKLFAIRSPSFQYCGPLHLAVMDLRRKKLGQNKISLALCSTTLRLSTPDTASGPGFASITEGFVLTDHVTMQETRQLASMFAARKRSPQPCWRFVLNHTTSTRPMSRGGATCPPLSTLLVYHRVRTLRANSAPLVVPGSARTVETHRCLDACADDWWCAILAVPNSFSRMDGRALKVAAAAAQQTEAMQKACLIAFTMLMLRGPTSVVLRDSHWASGDVTSLQQAAAAISDVLPPAHGSGPAMQLASGTSGSGATARLALAPPVCSSRAWAYYESPAAGAQTARNEFISDILSKMIRRSPTGWLKPGTVPRGGWQLLRRYVPPGGLAEFIREHTQFELRPVTQTIWEFGFAKGHRSDTVGMAVPVSDSAVPCPAEDHEDDTSLLDLAELELFIEWQASDVREVTRQKCEHGEWLRREPRHLFAGHLLAQYDSDTTPDTLAETLPHCCRLRHREERYDVDSRQWQVWDYEEGLVDEDIFYQFEGLS